MKRIISFVTALTLLCTIAVTGFAQVTSVSDTRTAATTLTNNETKVNKTDGVIDENGTTLSISKENPAQYLFESGDYTYSLLDKDSDGNYFILSADRYGKISLNSTAVNNIFDPTPALTDASHANDLNLAVWLNNDFLNGTSTYGTMTANYSKTAIDSAVKNYIVTHDWYIEGNGQAADETKHLTSATTNDFKVNCKIALPSWKEYIKYSDKIGYASEQYVDNGLTVSTTIVLRTPNNSSTSLYYFSEKTGSISGSFNATTTKAPTTVYMRPCFYVSREYFANTHLTNIGSEVKSILREDFSEEELKAAGYTTDEITDIMGTGLKSGFIMTDDMENGTDSWVKKTITEGTASAEAVNYPSDGTDKAMELKYPTYAYLKLDEAAESGILTVDADITVNGGNFGVGFVESGKQNMIGKLYPVYIGNGQKKISAIINRDASSYDVSDETIASDYLKDDGETLKITYSTTFHMQLIINAASGKCAVKINDALSKTIDIPYIGTDKEQTAIGAIAFMNRQGNATESNPAYIDDVKICYDPLGSVISQVNTGNNKIKVTMRSGIDTSKFTKESIVLKNNLGTALTVSSAELLDDGSILLETSDTLTVGNTYRLSVPSLNSEYPVTETQFTYAGGSFSAVAEITTENYAKGETAAAACKINAADFIGRTVMFYIASYNGDNLIDVNLKKVDISKGEYGEINETLELVLTDEADCIKAFVWDENQVPYNVCDKTAKTN